MQMQHENNNVDAISVSSGKMYACIAPETFALDADASLTVTNLEIGAFTEGKKMESKRYAKESVFFVFYLAMTC